MGFENCPLIEVMQGYVNSISIQSSVKCGLDGRTYIARKWDL